MITVLCEKYDKSVNSLLNKLNVNLMENCVIAGNAKTLLNYMTSAVNNSEVMVFVGETYEMKELVAKAFDLTMFYDKHSEQNVDKFCKAKKQPSPPQYLLDRLCSLPESFQHYAPVYSMQCSCYGEYNKCHIFILPKNEREIAVIFDTYIKKMLSSMISSSIKKVYKIFGLTKQEILDRVASVTANKLITVQCDSDEYLDNRLVILFAKPIANTIVNTVDRRINEIFDTFLYANYDTTLQQEVVETLKEVQKTVAVAESLTGGMIASSIVEISGASKVLYEGVVTYSVHAKCNRLGLNPHFIDRYGVVSNEVAYQMAESLLKQENVDFSISTTGIAGPASYPNQPVGLCYIGIGGFNGVKVYRNIFIGNREQIRHQATNFALFLLLQTVKTKINNVPQNSGN